MATEPIECSSNFQGVTASANGPFDEHLRSLKKDSKFPRNRIRKSHRPVQNLPATGCRWCRDRCQSVKNLPLAR